jgi:hypothetical protein
VEFSTPLMVALTTCRGSETAVCFAFFNNSAACVSFIGLVYYVYYGSQA